MKKVTQTKEIKVKKKQYIKTTKVKKNKRK